MGGLTLPKRSTALLAALAMLVTAPLTAAGGCDLVPELCGFSLSVGPVSIHGDETIGDGEESTYDEGAHMMNGEVEVQGGGRLTIDNATVRFTNSSDGIVVRDGGELIIRASDIGTVESTRNESLISVEPGAKLTMLDTDFRRFTVRIATNDTLIDNLVFAESPLALVLDTVNITIDDSQFHDNHGSILVLGGSPTIQANEFFRGAVEIDVYHSNATIYANDFEGSMQGISMHDSEGDVEYNFMYDKADPLSIAIEIVEASGALTVQGNWIDQWGTGIRLRDNDGHVTLVDNHFGENGQDIDTDGS